MQSTNYYCDMCGNEIDQWKQPKFKSTNNKELRIQTDNDEGADICSDCLSAIQKIVEERSKK